MSNIKPRKVNMSFVNRYQDMLFNALLLNNLLSNPSLNIVSTVKELADIMQERVAEERVRLIKELFKYRVPGNAFDVPENGHITVILPNCNFSITVTYSDIKKIHMGAYPINTHVQITDKGNTVVYPSSGNISFIGV